MFEARRLLEPSLARRAAQEIDQRTLDRLTRLVDAQKGMTDDPVRFQISDREFHLAIFAVAGNPVSEDDQWRKLELVVRVAERVWGHAA